MPTISILIVDDHQLILDAWTHILNSDERFEVIGVAGDSVTALSLIKFIRPQIILCDISLGPQDGIEVTKEVRLISPTSKIIGVSMHNIPAYVKKMFHAGASGYVTKNSPVAELKFAITEVKDGKNYVCREIKEKIAMAELVFDNQEGLDKLTKKEIDVIQAVKAGLSSREIAARLDIKMKTVEVHRYNILKKLGLRNTAALINFMNLRGI